MWLARISIVVLFLIVQCSNCDVIDAEVVDAQPAEVNTEPEVVIDKDRAGIEPIKYDGAQLWRVKYGNQDYKNAVAELQKEYKLSMWNLQMVNTSDAWVDLFVKGEMVDDARQFLDNVNVPYDVIIDDVQSAIDNENPPLDQIDLWQNRNGEL